MQQTMSIHFTGNFLTWHRWFLYSYEQALRNECGYKGYAPYWDWLKWADAPEKSPIFNGMPNHRHTIQVLIPPLRRRCILARRQRKIHSSQRNYSLATSWCHWRACTATCWVRKWMRRDWAVQGFQSQPWTNRFTKCHSTSEPFRLQSTMHEERCWSRSCGDLAYPKNSS